MNKPIPDLQTEDHLGFLIHEVSRVITAAYDTSMGPLGLTRTQVRVVAYVDQYPGLTQAELSEYVGTSPMAMTGLLDRMELKDLVKRVDDPSDRRVKRLFLTRGALKLKPDMDKITEALEQRAIKGVSKQQYRTVMNVLKTIRANLVDIAEES